MRSTHVGFSRSDFLLLGGSIHGNNINMSQPIAALSSSPASVIGIRPPPLILPSTGRNYNEVSAGPTSLNLQLMEADLYGLKIIITSLMGNLESGSGRRSRNEEEEKESGKQMSSGSVKLGSRTDADLCHISGHSCSG